MAAGERRRQPGVRREATVDDKLGIGCPTVLVDVQTFELACLRYAKGAGQFAPVHQSQRDRKRCARHGEGAVCLDEEGVAPTTVEQAGYDRAGVYTGWRWQAELACSKEPQGHRAGHPSEHMHRHCADWVVDAELLERLEADDHGACSNHTD